MYTYQEPVPVLDGLGDATAPESSQPCPPGQARDSSGICIGGPAIVALGERRLLIIKAVVVAVPAVATIGLFSTGHRKGAIAAGVVTGVALLGVLALRPLARAMLGP